MQSNHTVSYPGLTADLGSSESRCYGRIADDRLISRFSFLRWNVAIICKNISEAISKLQPANSIEEQCSTSRIRLPYPASPMTVMQSEEFKMTLMSVSINAAQYCNIFVQLERDSTSTHVNQFNILGTK